jgi:hypothetical protein
MALLYYFEDSTERIKELLLFCIDCQRERKVQKLTDTPAAADCCELMMMSQLYMGRTHVTVTA